MQDALDTFRSTDSFFGAPYIDIDEQRTVPVPHRYLHGGFSSTATRFSFYFPPHYEGRFFQYLEGGYGGNENASSFTGGAFLGLAYAASRGGFFVESNQGHIGAEPCPKAGGNASVYAYRASAECARLARHLAAAIYGQGPKHCYLFGLSGGGHRTLCCMEFVNDVWDGGVAGVVGAPNTFRDYAAMNNARRVLGSRFEHVVDAAEPGGSGDPFEHLDTEQREALAHLYASGFPRGGERSVPQGLNAGLALWAWNADLLIQHQPEYFETFWSERGHAGADGLLNRHVIDTKATVAKVVTPEESKAYPLSGFGRMLLQAPPHKRVGITLEGNFPSNVEGARITVLSGAAAGRRLYCTNEAEGLLVGSSIGEAQTLLFDGVEAGDEVALDNRDFLAYCYYYRHHSPSMESARRLYIDGHSIYPQHVVVSPHAFSSPVFGTVERTGAIQSPVFLLQHTLDTSGWPSGALACENDVRAHLGERTDSQFRLWWVDNAEHISASAIPARANPAPTSRLIDYAGAYEAGLDAMVAWIERGVTPPTSTNYAFDVEDNRVCLSASASERGGIQPLVTAAANGAIRADVGVGEEVTLSAAAEAPAGAGSIVEIAWDYEGSGTWSEIHVESTPGSLLLHETRHRFDQPGTYFPAVRVIAHHEGDADDPHARVMNLGRCRVVVE